ncbi:radical SAM protein [Clostridium sp. DL1XJH146]
MHYTGQVYRHPVEGATDLLEVTVGCSHNKCTFCTMYRDTCFSISPKDYVEEDLQELKSRGRSIKRIFLVNGEPFVLSTAKLIEIGEKINSYFPEIETITCYASIKNLKNKSLEDLKKLRSLKYNQLHIGLESAYDPALKQMNKGFTKEEAYENLKKLTDAGFEWDALLMTGVAGKGNGKIHIEETAKLINTFPPYMVSVMPTSVTKGSELEVLRDKGEFVDCTELEKLEEEKMLLRLLEFEDAYFFGSHNYNLVPVSAQLKYKQEILDVIDKKIMELDDDLLNSVLERDAI